MKDEELENYFTTPKIISPFYRNVKRIPRKLKKSVKYFCWVHWIDLSNEQRLWYSLEKRNTNYKTFLIKQIIKQK